MVKIFVGRLAETVVKEDLEQLFGKFGEVTDCSVLKNYGFIHMADIDEANSAITDLDKHNLKGNQINVEISTTKVQKATKIFVGNLPAETKSAEVHKLFKQFGTVIECDVIRNYAFVHMGRDTMAREAISALNNTEYNGNRISVQMARQKPGENDGGPAMFEPRHEPLRGMVPVRGYPPVPHRRLMSPRQYPHPRRPPHYMPDVHYDDPYARPNRRLAMRPRLLHPSAAAAPPMLPRDLGPASAYSQQESALGHRRGGGGEYMMRERESLSNSLYPSQNPYRHHSAAAEQQRYSYAPSEQLSAASGLVDSYSSSSYMLPGYGSGRAPPVARYASPPLSSSRYTEKYPGY